MQDKEALKIILENIQTKVSPQVYGAYFSEISLALPNPDRSSLTIFCKNHFTKQAIESRYHQTLLKSVRNVLGDDNLEIEFVIKKSSVPITQQNLFSSFQNKTQSLPQSSAKPGGLNPKYTFETFVVGSGNQLAHAASLAISDNPGNAYNPFFIYGGVGLGKTHLMQAVGHSLLEKNPEAKILYCSTESFLNEMVTSIRTQKTPQFRDKYRSLDLLLLDDIQFISNRTGLQEEFFNTFNTLYQAGKQIIFASDRPPSEISHLEERIKSRFEGGLVADVKSPNIETRVAILQKKLIDRNEYLPDPIIFTIAEYVDSNIRELEGALLKVSIFAKTNNNVVTSSDVESLLGEKIKIKKKKINPLDIMNAVCEELEVSLKDVKSSKRHYDIAFARQVCMYLLKDILKLQLVKIARHVGRNDHTTIMHGINKIEKLIIKDQDIARQILDLKSKIL
jgi:chromosomal replication initiator protein